MYLQFCLPRKEMFALNPFLELKPLFQRKCNFYENATNSSTPLTPKVVYSIPLLQSSLLRNTFNVSSLHEQKNKIPFLRSLPKKNTALLSTFCACVHVQAWHVTFLQYIYRRKCQMNRQWTHQAQHILNPNQTIIIILTIRTTLTTLIILTYRMNYKEDKCRICIDYFVLLV